MAGVALVRLFSPEHGIYSHRLGLKAENTLLAQDVHVTRLHVGIGTVLSF